VVHHWSRLPSREVTRLKLPIPLKVIAKSKSKLRDRRTPVDFVLFVMVKRNEWAIKMAQSKTSRKTNAEINAIRLAKLFEWKNLNSKKATMILKKANRMSRKDADEYFDLLENRKRLAGRIIA
jgi:hypothetical protein